ncbi:hypothetical protein [Formosa sp. PL04]|uniref:hypothetical protein n=1 Tax=Formosa sp. PL04 TaxID=3081755 RepID=UPI002982B5C3|nr:hypothetical protein [Formosa sp. PL04]MDW5288065.1 hypothetical protein [Formosa sp. PL04]
MKKILFILMLVCSFSSAFAQNKTQEKKINYFVDAANKEFSLDKAQTKSLLKARNTYVSEYMAVTKDFKAGTLTQDEKKTKLNVVNGDFNQSFSDITGKTQQELKPFSERMQTELKKV